MREGGNRLKRDPSQAKAQRPAYQKKLDARAKLPGGTDAPDCLLAFAAQLDCTACRHARRTRSLVFVPLLAAAKARAAIIDMIERNQERPLRLKP